MIEYKEEDGVFKFRALCDECQALSIWGLTATESLEYAHCTMDWTIGPKGGQALCFVCGSRKG